MALVICTVLDPWKKLDYLAAAVYLWPSPSLVAITDRLTHHQIDARRRAGLSPS